MEVSGNHNVIHNYTTINTTITNENSFNSRSQDVNAGGCGLTIAVLALILIGVPFLCLSGVLGELINAFL